MMEEHGKKEEWFLEFLHRAEQLKCAPRHSWTSSGRRESVAEHSWRLGLAAWLLKEEFPQIDLERLLELCLLHDLGEAVTGDVPCFEKEAVHEREEERAVKRLAEILPEEKGREFLERLSEFEKGETPEGKIARALDKMEAVIQHNEADMATWLPLEYDLQLTHGEKEAKDVPELQGFREAVRQETREKIRQEGRKEAPRKGFYVSKDPKKLSLERVVALMGQSYWAKDRSREMIRGAMEHSLCYGVYDEQDYMVGYARVITDHTTTFYLMDVIIDEAYRHQGLGTMLMDQVMEDMEGLHGVLHTTDAQEFYQRYGFGRPPEKLAAIMEKLREEKQEAR